MTAKVLVKKFLLVASMLGAVALTSVAVAGGSHGGHSRSVSYGHGGGGHNRGYGGGRYYGNGGGRYYGHGGGHYYGNGGGRYYGHGGGHYYGHRHYYPAYGYAYAGLPYGYSSVYYGGAPYYYYGGAWYRPYGPRFVVVAPPIGIGIGVLPPYYSTLWYGGAPYYYANRTYYQWYPERREYVVTRPPENAPAEVRDAPSDSEDIFVYPKNGQSESQQSNDRYECHAWAVQQSGFDPTRQNGGVSDSEIASRRAAYRRAEVACLEGRGYSVR